MNLFGLDSIVEENDLVFMDTNIFCDNFPIKNSSIKEKIKFYKKANPFFESFANYLVNNEDDTKIKVTREIFCEIPRRAKIRSKGKSTFGNKNEEILRLRRYLNQFYSFRNKILNELEFLNERIMNEDYTLDKEGEEYFTNLRIKVDNSLRKKRKKELSNADYGLFRNSFFISNSKRVALISRDEGVYLLWKMYLKDNPWISKTFSYYGFNLENGFNKSRV